MIYQDMLCVIPARRGSKRLPLKNIKMLAGKPMIAYSIDVALSAGVFNEVVVSTEDDEIADIAKSFGAVVHMIPKELAGDLISSLHPCLHAWRTEKYRHYKDLICLQPTSPMILPNDVLESITKYYKMDANFLVSSTHIDAHYFHWGMEPIADGFFELYFGNKYMKERPLLPSIYRPNGGIKLAKFEVIEKVMHFFGPKLTTYELPEERSIHVATEFEFDVCEFLLNRRKGK